MTEVPLTVVSDADVAAYARDGVVCLRSVFDRRWLELVARGVERNLAAPGPRGGSITAPGRPGAFFKDACSWERIPEYREFVLHSPAAAVAARVMRSRRVSFFLDSCLVKEPGTLDRTPWHQDQPYFCVDGDRVCGLWMPLDPVDRENGMAFVAGSHRWGRWFNPREFRGDQAERQFPGAGFESAPDVDGRPEAYSILRWNLDPGDCLLFHMLALHSSAGNASRTQRRRALAIHWVGDDAVYTKRAGKLSAPHPVPGFHPGDPLDRHPFPVVWPPEEGS